VREAAVVLFGLGLSCAPSAPAPTCVDVSVDCAPLYDPTFEQVFTRTLRPTCAASGFACHAAKGAQGGLVFEEQRDAYARVSRTVVAGDPRCSELVRRVTSTDPDVAMPPGKQLVAAEQCAIIQWVAAGAKP